MLILQLILNLWLLKDGLDSIEHEFEQFIDKYGKSYRNNVTEYHRRKEIFHNSLKQIQYLNSFRTHEESAKYGLTKYSDMAPHEFIEIVSKNDRRHQRNQTRVRISRALSSAKVSEKEGITFERTIKQSFDWRNEGKVSKVRSQGKCGACWAHSIVATAETMLAIKTGHLTELSVQQLVDCSSETGCEGGDTCSTLAWMVFENIPLQSREKYPSLDHAEKCHLNKTGPGVRIAANFTCDNFVNYEDKMVKLLANHGPLVAAVDASTWQHYLGGTIQYHCYNDHNHAVQITGYELDTEVPYFKVRNTWDVDFGIDGYIHIAIGKNLCGIADEVSALTIKSYPNSYESIEYESVHN